ERSCVSPPAVENAVPERTFREIVVIQIGDFQFTASRRSERADFLENRRVINIKTGHREIGFGLLRLLFDANDLIALKHRHTESFRVRHFLQKNMRTTAPSLKFLATLSNI